MLNGLYPDFTHGLQNIANGQLGVDMLLSQYLELIYNFQH